MKLCRIATTCIISFVVAGCATSYQASSFFRTGYSETWLAPDVVKVTFQGNGHTRPEQANDMALLRASELTLQKGYSHFALLANSNYNQVNAITTPTQTRTSGVINTYGNNTYVNTQSETDGGDTVFISKPSSTNVIRLFKGNSTGNPMLFDADFLCNSIGKKYNTTCGNQQ